MDSTWMWTTQEATYCETMCGFDIFVLEDWQVLDCRKCVSELTRVMLQYLCQDNGRLVHVCALDQSQPWSTVDQDWTQGVEVQNDRGSYLTRLWSRCRTVDEHCVGKTLQGQLQVLEFMKKIKEKKKRKKGERRRRPKQGSQEAAQASEPGPVWKIRIDGMAII